MRSASLLAACTDLKNRKPAVGSPVMAKKPRMGAYRGESGWMMSRMARCPVYSKMEPICRGRVGWRGGGVMSGRVGES